MTVHTTTKTNTASARMVLNYVNTRPRTIVFDGRRGIELLKPISQFTSSATHDNGIPYERVLIRPSVLPGYAIESIPDADGNWFAFIPPGEWDVTWITEGCQPIAHGTYSISG